MHPEAGVMTGPILQFPKIQQKILSPGIVTVSRQGMYGLVITFSDGTYARYVVEELLELRPHREMHERI